MQNKASTCVSPSSVFRQAQRSQKFLQPQKRRRIPRGDVSSRNAHGQHPHTHTHTHCAHNYSTVITKGTEFASFPNVPPRERLLLHLVAIPPSELTVKVLLRQKGIHTHRKSGMGVLSIAMSILTICGFASRVRASRSRAQSPCSPGQYPPSPLRQRATTPGGDDRGHHGTLDRKSGKCESSDKKIPKSTSRELCAGEEHKALVENDGGFAVT